MVVGLWCMQGVPENAAGRPGCTVLLRRVVGVAASCLMMQQLLSGYWLVAPEARPAEEECLDANRFASTGYLSLCHHAGVVMCCRTWSLLSAHAPAPGHTCVSTPAQVCAGLVPL
jgi:hypothetical protein